MFPEPGSIDARRIIGGAERLVAPELLFAELANVIVQKVHRGETGGVPSPRLVAELLALPVEPVALSILTADALALALAFDHPVYDCYYIATTLAYDAVIVTADLRLGALARAAGLDERVRLLIGD